jgi:DNA-binding NarL/FixJ family response regulator
MLEPHSAGVVMLVDDNPETLRMVIDALEGVGLTALVARDGPSALNLLNRIEPDVILLDAVMPGMNGFELCRKIKEMPAFASTPVLFMTGLSCANDVVTGLRAGGVDYIVKPINPSEMIARITNHVANARLIASARTVIDATDAAVVAIAENGTVSWQTSRAAAELSEATGQADAIMTLVASPDFQSWLQSVRLTPISETNALKLANAGTSGARLEVMPIGRSSFNEILCRITVIHDADPIRRLEQMFALSRREAEVLLWITRGKANRDIADLLEISPRTVTKHVEQILTKLGVENRTAAAVLAITTGNTASIG